MTHPATPTASPSRICTRPGCPQPTTRRRSPQFPAGLLVGLLVGLAAVMIVSTFGGCASGHQVDGATSSASEKVTFRVVVPKHENDEVEVAQVEATVPRQPKAESSPPPVGWLGPINGVAIHRLPDGSYLVNDGGRITHYANPDAPAPATPNAEPDAPATPNAEPDAPATPNAEPDAPATPNAEPDAPAEPSAEPAACQPDATTSRHTAAGARPIEIAAAVLAMQALAVPETMPPEIRRLIETSPGGTVIEWTQERGANATGVSVDSSSEQVATSHDATAPTATIGGDTSASASGGDTASSLKVWAKGDAPKALLIIGGILVLAGVVIGWLRKSLATGLVLGGSGLGIIILASMLETVPWLVYLALGLVLAAGGWFVWDQWRDARDTRAIANKAATEAGERALSERALEIVTKGLEAAGDAAKPIKRAIGDIGGNDPTIKNRIAEAKSGRLG